MRNEVVERAIQSVQGMTRTVRGATEEQLEVKKHSVWPWIAEQAGLMATKFEVGRDGKTPHQEHQQRYKACQSQKESSGRRDEHETRLGS